jgi:hypothetical protein
MADENERVTIEMAASDRLRLDQQINGRMEKLGYTPYNYAELELGFELPANWPADMNCQLTLAQLTVIAVKLNMRIIIDNINMVPLRDIKSGHKDGTDKQQL